jgi:hypothetical protein
MSTTAQEVMNPQEVHERLTVLRAKSRDNTITLDEVKEGIQLMRAGRTQAAKVSAKAKSEKSATAAKKAPINSDDLLSELDNM